MMGKKGLAAGLVVILIALFLFALSSLFTLALWKPFNDAIQSADNSTISPEVKEKVDGLTRYGLWGDKLFVTFFVVLLIAYIISSITLPADRPVYFIIFVVVVVFVTILAMILSNAWAYIKENPNFVWAASQLKFTDWFITYYPFVMFFVGLIGAVLFYTRRKMSFNVGGGFDGFE